MKPEHEEIIRKLEQNDSSLTVLNFRQKNLTSEESRIIFKALEDNTVVTDLQYLGNNSSGIAAIALRDMLKKNNTIKQLELGTNALNNKDLVHVVDGLKENSSVTILDLNSNLFDVAAPVADLLEHSICLEEIDLTNSNITDAGFSIIYQALQRNENSSLTTFNVYFPQISCMDDFDNFCRDNANRHGNVYMS